MRTLQKSRKCVEKYTVLRQLTKSVFSFRTLWITVETIRDRRRKMMISEPKIIRNGRNHEKCTAAEANHLNTVLKPMFKIVIFRKIIDADPTKITKMRRKIYTKLDNNRHHIFFRASGFVYFVVVY